MSRGTPAICFRLPPLLRLEIQLAIVRANLNRMEEPYNTTSWMIQAALEKLKHQERARKCRKARRAARESTEKPDLSDSTS